MLTWQHYTLLYKVCKRYIALPPADLRQASIRLATGTPGYPARRSGGQTMERKAARSSTSRALVLLRERMSANGAYGAFVHAEQQLERVLHELDRPGLPPADERQWLDIGLMAVKLFEASDRELADALMDADYDFKHAT